MKKKIFIFPVIFLLLLFARFLLLPNELSEEPVVKRQWVSRIPDNQQGAYGVQVASENPPIPFRLGNSFGYFRKDGSFTYTGNIMFGVTMNDSVFCNFPKISEEVIIQDYLGRIYSKFKSAGYPMIRENRLFFISTNRAGISEWNFDGEKLWFREFQSVITDFVVNENLLILGLSNGSLKILDNRGSTVDSHEFSFGAYHVAYGCALSGNNEKIAVISGINPQSITLLEFRENSFVPVKTWESGTDFRRRIRIDFPWDDDILAYETDRGIAFHAVDGRDAVDLQLAGSLIAMKKNKESDLLGIVSKVTGSDEGIISYITSDGKPLLSLIIPSNRIFLEGEGNQVFLGAADTMISFLLTRG